MRNKSVTICAAFVVFLYTFAVPTSRAIATFTNQGFETGNLAGWNVELHGGATLSVYNDGVPIPGNVWGESNKSNVRTGSFAAVATVAGMLGRYVVLSQTVDLEAGNYSIGYYLGLDGPSPAVAFEYAHNDIRVNGDSLGVYMEGAPFLWTGSDSQDFHLVSTQFNTTGGPAHIEFQISASHEAIVGVSIDDCFIVPEPARPPVADADGPYSIYVGDTLTLDASGSTDADDDIISYMWDLDDNGSFETDAGDQAVFDVNFAYLQSLELLINYPYTIHLKVTDSEEQSDVNESTLTILPKPAIQVAVDIKPGSCPNPLNVKSSGVLPVAVLGSETFDVSTIDVASVELAGVGVVRHNFEDVATPLSDVNDCNCTEDGPDGFLDLTLKFKTQDIVEAIGEVNDGDVLPLELTGVLFGERPMEGNDCVLIRGKFKPFNKADTNRDGVVDLRDFAIIAENWLLSSVVED